MCISGWDSIQVVNCWKLWIDRKGMTTVCASYSYTHSSPARRTSNWCLGRQYFGLTSTAIPIPKDNLKLHLLHCTARTFTEISTSSRGKENNISCHLPYFVSVLKERSVSLGAWSHCNRSVPEFRPQQQLWQTNSSWWAQAAGSSAC